ncbi:hypothetical protein KRR26_34875 [Corallococcus sp. M34]|uniref:hypothetical protein n=1 Tax=Citreicoccus inhibens TaxID=2849499 RepID=UPI001C21A681|nr:hypothetical protein [Citreicoccus inhibens]MBU8900801.1 hypothetical protein [Citreicoccus inhibens]
MPATSTPPPTAPPTTEGTATQQPSTSTAKSEATTTLVWPRDLNLPTSGELTWGFDPEGLRDG